MTTKGTLFHLRHISFVSDTIKKFFSNTTINKGRRNNCRVIVIQMLLNVLMVAYYEVLIFLANTANLCNYLKYG